ncbi:MAG: cren protein [Thermoprotei archaeon]|nr:MAG: cren protein [Thermoprotei archaeon]RLE97049.1 MAG: cren protein [Thermoprotei archaeon]HDI75131.1 cren protein [Thermoprotei archaeon]
MATEKKILACIKVKVASLNDLARYAASIVSSRPFSTTCILHFKENQKNIYGILAVFNDYYNLYGLPIFYYYETSSELRGSYVLIKVDEKKENIVISNGVKPGWIHIPIISLAEKPKFL